MATHTTNGSTNGTTNGSNGDVRPTPALCASAPEFLASDYDFVIIGGGTAGLVLAARLTENEDVRVGVLEAGPSRLDDPLVDVPAAFLHMLGNPDYDWCLKTEPQPVNHDMVHHVVRGKMLGGSSGINYMMYVRGSDEDYNDWADLVDDKSWSSKAMKKYMRKHQTLEPIDPSISDVTNYPHVGENHGTKGPIHTSFNDTPMPLEAAAIGALDDAAGLSKKPTDPWSGDHVGFYNTLGCVTRNGPNKGKRSYSAREYFEPNATRPNLKVLCDASVHKISLDGTTATGVEFEHSGQRHYVKVGKEVILSAGAFHSPQILELSGIGNPDILKAAGVECKVELPGVGEYLQDHLLSAIGYELTPDLHSGDILYIPEVMAGAQQQYAATLGGPLSSIGCVNGFFPYKNQSSAEELEQTIQSIRDLQNQPSTSAFYKKQLDQVIAQLESDRSGNMSLYLIPLTADFDNGVQTQRLFPPMEAGLPHQFTLGSGIQYPVARGSVHITDSNISSQPKINPAYLTHPADIDVLASALRFLDRAANVPALKEKISRRVFPAPEVKLDVREQAKQAAKDWCMTTYHPMGTCTMGEVVDSRLKVHGVKGLRVCDASVFPNNVSGNICSTVYMVAERTADIIKEDYGFPISD